MKRAIVISVVLGGTMALLPASAASAEEKKDLSLQRAENPPMRAISRTLPESVAEPPRISRSARGTV